VFANKLNRPWQTLLFALLLANDSYEVVPAQDISGKLATGEKSAKDWIEQLKSPDTKTRRAAVEGLRGLEAAGLDGSPFLRHELYHIKDMLDPAFGYDPALPDCEGEPARLNLLLRRYRVLWDTVIDGRLWKSGRARDGIKEAHQREFACTFQMLGERARAAFEQWFDLPRPTHAALMQFALNPCPALGIGESAAASVEICPLCNCSARIEPSGTTIPEPIISEILKDFPNWKPIDGICRQCTDLYSTRPLSRSAMGAFAESLIQLRNDGHHLPLRSTPRPPRRRAAHPEGA
jgi:hypothetical protein